MRLAAFSDIHGNLIALQAVLADMATVPDIDVSWCLGDLAAFGPRPLECVGLVKAMSEQDEGKKCRVIGGNTDRYLVGGERMRMPSAQDEAEFRKLPVELQTRDTVINWTLAQLDFDAYQFLRSIVRREVSTDVDGFGTIIGYHAIPGDDEAFLTAQTTDELAADYLLDREGLLAIGGHIHRQFDRQVGSWRIINIGSVGMSVDQPGFAQYAIITFDGDRVDIDLRAIPYDTEAAIADLHAAGHPNPDWLISKLRPASA
jgi:predicted phosphodiesterase